MTSVRTIPVPKILKLEISKPMNACGKAKLRHHGEVAHRDRYTARIWKCSSECPKTPGTVAIQAQFHKGREAT